MEKVHLVRDVLDNQLMDREECPMGKVDGIVLVLRKGKPPRLAYLEVGMSTLAHRISTRLGKFAERLGRKRGVRRGEPFRIPWTKVRDVGIDVEVEMDASETPVLDWEKWLNERVVRRIPGGG
jgi:sporulation protein YlmC with PRC-barrel domain